MQSMLWSGRYILKKNGNILRKSKSTHTRVFYKTKRIFGLTQLKSLKFFFQIFSFKPISFFSRKNGWTQSDQKSKRFIAYIVAFSLTHTHTHDWRIFLLSLCLNGEIHLIRLSPSNSLKRLNIGLFYRIDTYHNLKWNCGMVASLTLNLTLSFYKEKLRNVQTIETLVLKKTCKMNPSTRWSSEEFGE